MFTETIQVISRSMQVRETNEAFEDGDDKRVWWLQGKIFPAAWLP